MSMISRAQAHRLTYLIAGFAAFLSAGAAQAAVIDFNWSFYDKWRDVTVEGMVFGLEDNATSAATSVMITDDGGLTFVLPQETIDGAFRNSWTLSNGVITAVHYESWGFDLLFDYVRFKGEGDIKGKLFDGLAFKKRKGWVTFEPKDVPAPATIALMALGLAGVGAAMRRKARRS